jgi:ComF family protein
VTEIVIPVPLHPERERERGYNQANLLVQYFCREIGLNSDLMALQRVRHTRPQVGLDPTARRENVEGAFRAESARVAGKRILLLDDVFTTGATMTAASQALLDCGARQVAGICVARAAGPADKI